MQALAAPLRVVLIALVLLAIGYPATQAQSVNPTKSAVSEQQLLQQFKTIRGLGTIPDTKSYTLEQPAGRDWRHFHEVTLRWIGGIAIVGMLALLVSELERILGCATDRLGRYDISERQWFVPLPSLTTASLHPRRGRQVDAPRCRR
jgi:hypothetical protein